tara:strand:+ start:219 stop:371 length:153 start_codon:yes stop_codon:yes gene_type:complete
MTRQEFWQWLDTCPANFDEDGNRVANPTFEIINDDFENTTIRFRVTEPEN